MYNYQHQHKTERGTCKVCGRETNSISSALDINYCANCWNKELKGKSNIKEGTSVFMSTLTDTSHIRETLLKQYENKVNWRDLPSPPEDSRERVPGK
jgi:hypothetical protein